MGTKFCLIRHTFIWVPGRGQMMFTVMEQPSLLSIWENIHVTLHAFWIIPCVSEAMVVQMFTIPETEHGYAASAPPPSSGAGIAIPGSMGDHHDLFDGGFAPSSGVGLARSAPVKSVLSPKSNGPLPLSHLTRPRLNSNSSNSSTSSSGGSRSTSNRKPHQGSRYVHQLRVLPADPILVHALRQSLMSYFILPLVCIIGRVTLLSNFRAWAVWTRADQAKATKSLRSCFVQLEELEKHFQTSNLRADVVGQMRWTNFAVVKHTRPSWENFHPPKLRSRRQGDGFLARLMVEGTSTEGRHRFHPQLVVVLLPCLV